MDEITGVLQEKYQQELKIAMEEEIKKDPALCGRCMMFGIILFQIQLGKILLEQAETDHERQDIAVQLNHHLQEKQNFAGPHPLGES